MTKKSTSPVSLKDPIPARFPDLHISEVPVCAVVSYFSMEFYLEGKHIMLTTACGKSKRTGAVTACDVDEPITCQDCLDSWHVIEREISRKISP